MHSIDLEKFLKSPKEALIAALKKRQTAVVDNEGKTQLLIGTNCESYWELPEFEEPAADDAEIHRDRWLK